MSLLLGKVNFTLRELRLISLKMSQSCLENAIYIGNEQKIKKGIILKYGLRYSMYSYLGPSKEYTYGERASITESRELLEEKGSELSIFLSARGLDNGLSICFFKCFFN